MIARDAFETVTSLARDYPVVAVTGPRQAGKTTLARAAFPRHAYASLENQGQREFADADPAGFLRNFTTGVILDEVQRCPRLFEMPCATRLSTTITRKPKRRRVFRPNLCICKPPKAT